MRRVPFNCYGNWLSIWWHGLWFRKWDRRSLSGKFVARKLYELMSWTRPIVIPRPGDPENTHKEEFKKYPLTTTIRQLAAVKNHRLKIFSDWLIFCLHFILYISRLHLQTPSAQSDIECLFSLLAPSYAAWLLFAPSASYEFVISKKKFSREFNWSLKMKSKQKQWNQSGCCCHKNVSLCDDLEQMERKICGKFSLWIQRKQICDISFGRIHQHGRKSLI